MNQSPSVSVVIPTFDRIDLLRRHALASALSQEGVDVDVIVVCDGSPAHVVEAAKRYPDPRVQIIENPRSLGVAGARNTGIDRAEADWIAILDDDDLWAPTKLARLVAAAIQARAGFAYSGAVILDEAYRARSLTPAPAPEGLLDELLCRNVMPGGGSNLVLSRDAAREVGGFDGSLAYASDWDMAIRLAAQSPAAAVPEMLSAWVRHSKATAPKLSRAYQDLARLKVKHSVLLNERGVAIDNAATLLWVGNSELDAGGLGYRVRALRAFGALAIAERKPTALVHAGRALLGRSVNMWLRGRLRERPPRPEWLDRYSPNVA